MKRDLLIKFRGTRSQQEMAEMYGISQQSWSSWENGDKTPTVINMKRLEKDIKEPMEKIFFDVFNDSKL